MTNPVNASRPWKIWQDPSAPCGDGVELIDAVEELGEPRQALVYLDACTGLRRNEILALHYCETAGRDEPWQR